MSRNRHEGQSAKGMSGHDFGHGSGHQADQWVSAGDEAGNDPVTTPGPPATDAALSGPLWARRIRIERVRLRNFKVFRDVAIGPLPRIAFFVGANGTGKSTLFDAFGFLRDCMVHDVAFALGKRGGYRAVKTREAKGGIGIELKFRMEVPGVRRLVTYALDIGADESGTPYVERETLRYRRGTGRTPFHVISFTKGAGDAVANEEDSDIPDALLAREQQSLGPGVLAVKALGQFKRFGTAFALRSNVEKWHVSDFHLAAASINDKAAFREHLSASGKNLGVVARHLQPARRN